jgi:hypothetical protein
VSQKEPNRRDERADDELDAEEIAEGAVEFFGADHKGEPAGDSDIPVPPG